MAQILDGKPHVDKMSEIDLHDLNRKIRLQRIIFVAAGDVYLDMTPSWKGNKEFLLAQIVGLVEKFIRSGKVNVVDVVDDDLRAKMTMLFNMQKIVSHVCKSIKDCNVESRRIHLNPARQVKSTSDMRPWYTKKPAEYTVKSHISMAVYDSGWEMGAGQELERNKNVMSWVRNDHVGFVIKYLYNGTVRDYWPDFLIRLRNNVTLVLEIESMTTRTRKSGDIWRNGWMW